MILHVVNTSPFQTHSLSNALAQMGPTDTLLLIQDAVVASTLKGGDFKQLSSLFKDHRLWVLLDDLNARGLSPKIGESADYPQFVKLSLEAKRQIAW